MPPHALAPLVATAAAAAAAMLLVPIGAAVAGALAVAPTRVELAPDQRAAVVTLQNNGAEPVLVQVQTFAWPDSAATADLAPTRELVAVPPVATIPPGEKQLIRVAVRGAARADVESAYRLVITEVPPELSGPRAGVRFALRLSLPVFIVPPGTAPVPAWSLEPGADGAPRLTLANRGSAHVQVRRIEVVGGKGGREVVHVIEEPAYVLPAQRRQWRLPLGVKAPLALKVESNVGELDAAIPQAPGS